MRKLFLVVLCLSYLYFPNLLALEASELSELVGYTILEVTNASGEFEGADYEKLIKLDNGMIFQFNEYNYSYSYRPDVAVLAKKVTFGGKSLIIWKLIIEDEIYDVVRVK